MKKRNPNLVRADNAWEVAEQHLTKDEFKKSTQFKLAWIEWVTHRRIISKPITLLAVKRQISSLESWGLDKSLTAIDRSIANGWTGLFEPKDDHTDVNRRVIPADEWLRRPYNP